MAVTAGNNVSFLIGTQEKINTLLSATSGITAGAFYVTNDTNRLYFGADATKLVALNQGVQTVGTTAELTNPEAGQFYYVADANVLCVYNGSQWVQINPDNNTTNKSSSTTVSDVTSNMVTVTNSITDSAGNSVSSGFSLQGDGLTITKDGTTIKLTAPAAAEYSVTTGAGQINLTKNGAVAATAKITGSNGVTVGGSSSGITITGNQVTGISGAATASSNTGTISGTIAQSNGDSKSGDLLKLTGKDGVVITKGTANQELVVDGETYKVSASSATNGASVKLTGSHGNDSNFDVVGGDNVTVVLDGSNVKISAEDTVVSDVTATVDSTGHISVAVSQSGSADTKTGTSTVALTAKYGANGDQSAIFGNGVATLNVYSKSEIDSKLTDIQQQSDAMYFAGVLTAAPTSTMQIGNGYTYKVSGSFNLEVGEDAVVTTLKTGDLLIATGTESSSGYIPFANIVWQYVPAGDDIDDYVTSFVDHGLKIIRKNVDDIGTLALKEGEGISLQDTNSGTSKTVEVALKAINPSTTSEAAISQAAKGELTFTAVTGVTYDSYGRVTGVSTKKITVKDTDTHVSLKSNTASVSSVTGGAHVENTVALSEGDSKTAGFDIKSNAVNLDISGSGTAITMNLVWGSF